MSRTYLPPEPCHWCGWLNGEHASACDLIRFTAGKTATLAWPPGRNEPGHQTRTGESHVENPAKLDCPE